VILVMTDNFSAAKIIFFWF